ncbi:ABC transporter permease [Nonomuraea jabiensis]|uniref:Transport permease protein n=1 Tax=Nonomuraea sp. MJM5123 TaxID=1562372 RepID=A0A1R7SQM3_9ACTN|nr:putative ABC transporter [Nonomuraea sp. MJM5123]
MTVSIPPRPRSAAERLRWELSDGFTIGRRYLTHWVAEPGRIVASLVFPGMMVLLFGYVFGSAMVVPGGGDYREFLMPGLFVMTMAMGIATTVTAVTADAARGITDRFRSLPMARSAVVTGRCLADMVNSVLDLVVLIACGLLVGWRWHGNLADAAAAVGLLLLLRFALVWVGIYLGLILPSPESVAVVLAPVYPLTMISNTFVSPQQLPEWLGAIAAWNPLSSTVSAARQLFGNPGSAGDTSWIAEHATLMAVVWPLALVVVFVPLAIRRYRGLSG